MKPLPFILNVREAGIYATISYRFAKAIVRIGRSRESDVPLVNRRMAVSRHHAEIRCVKGRFVLVDMESKNATRLHGLRLTPLQAYPLHCGDCFQVSDFVLEFRMSRAPDN